MKVQIGGTEFKSKQVAKKYVMNIVNELIGAEVRPESEHFGLLLSLWQRSPLYEEGGAYFLIGQKFDGVAIKTVTREGRIIDWSLRGAVSGKEICRWSKFIAAMRWAVRPHIVKFKERGGGCEKCGSSRHLEVDHILRFRDLIREYLEINGGEYPEHYMYSHFGYSFREVDEQFAAGWIKFHNSCCKLRLLCSDCHRVVTEQQRAEEQASEHTPTNKVN